MCQFCGKIATVWLSALCGGGGADLRQTLAEVAADKSNANNLISTDSHENIFPTTS